MQWKAVELPLSSRDMPSITMGINLNRITLPAPCGGYNPLLGGVTKFWLKLEKEGPRVAVTVTLPPILLEAQIKVTTSPFFHPNNIACCSMSWPIKGTEKQSPLLALLIPWSVISVMSSSVISLVSSSAYSTSGYTVDDSFTAKRASQYPLLTVVFCMYLQRDSLRFTLLLPNMNPACFTKLKKFDSDCVPVWYQA